MVEPGGVRPDRAVVRGGAVLRPPHRRHRRVLVEHQRLHDGARQEGGGACHQPLGFRHHRRWARPGRGTTSWAPTLRAATWPPASSTAGRASLIIGIASAVITCFFAIILGVMAGFFGGLTDSLISRSLDVIWAFPVYLLAIALGTALLVQGISVGPIAIDPASLWIPILIIGVVYIPYVARPVRGEVLSVCEQEFVEAAVAQGASTWRLMLVGDPAQRDHDRDRVPAADGRHQHAHRGRRCRFLGIGVQAPNASWGTLIADGQDLLYTRPLVSIAPGLMILVRPCSRSTCSATASATRSIRAPSCGRRASAWAPSSSAARCGCSWSCS